MITMNSQRACINDTPLNNEDFYYISDGTWYVKGSLCWLETNCGEAGALMLGVRASDNQLDGELCSWDEFDIYDKNHVLISEAVAELFVWASQAEELGPDENNDGRPKFKKDEQKRKKRVDTPKSKPHVEGVDE